MTPNEPVAEIWLPESEAPAPAVVLGGDLFTRRGRGLVAALGPELARRGYVAVAPAPSAACDTDAFEATTVEQRTADLEGAVTGLFERMIAPGRADIRKIALVGHGIGGTAAVAEAARDSRIGAVAAIAAPRTLEAAFPAAARDVWAHQGTARLRDEHDGREHDLGPALARDWKARAAELDHADGARKTEAPVLWVHGTEDRSVSVEDSRRAYWKHPDAGRRARLVEVAGAGHDFASAGEPSELSAHAKKVADAVCELLEAAFPKA
jgi:pimeloyl-ACP methyl ester carboxylesterase